MKNKGTLYILSILLAFVSFSCKTKVPGMVTKRISEKKLVSQLFKNSSIDYDFFYTKLNVDFKDSKKSQSFKTSIKMRIDSAFSGTISKGPYIAATYLIKSDSINVTNKQEKCYFSENLNYISALIGVELEYEEFQNLIVGKPLYIDEAIHYNQIKDKLKHHYILSSHKKRKFKRIDNETLNLDKDKNNDIFIKYYFSSDSVDLVKMNIEIPGDTVTIDVNYETSQIIDNFTVPKLTTIKIVHPRDSIFIELDYTKLKINQPKTIKFSVPSSYVDCYK
jgi:hypothetical protein